MSIDIEWQPKPPNRKGNDSVPQMFPRIVNSEVVDEDALAKIMSESDVYTRGQIKGILTTLSEMMAKLLFEGKTIELPYLGSFKLSIGTNNVIAPSATGSIHSIEVRGVNFQPCKELMDRISKPKFRVVARNAAPHVPSAADLIFPLSEYLETHGSITRTEFATIFRLKRTTACDRLKELQEMGVITSVGSNRDTKYFARNITQTNIFKGDD